LNIRIDVYDDWLTASLWCDDDGDDDDDDEV